jgi:hypothetical protein
MSEGLISNAAPGAKISPALKLACPPNPRLCAPVTAVTLRITAAANALIFILFSSAFYNTSKPARRQYL